MGSHDEQDDRDPTAAEMSPAASAPNEQESRGRRYAADGITVYFNPRTCWHSGVCVRGLPLVFDTSRRPWVDAAAASPQAIADQIDLCPSGALSYDLT